MTAIKAGDVDRAVASRSPDTGLLLFYGPDAGRVAERAREAARQAVDDPADPFQLVRVEGDALADGPGRLVEEATTFGMFGSRRAILVRPTGRNIAPAVSACLDTALIDTLVVIEAGDLPRTSSLRLACERSPRALALPCYADEDRDIAGLLAATLSAAGLTIEPDARHWLIEHLGRDRLATRGELDKLVLYAHGRETVTSEDVEAVVTDVSGPSTDSVIDAAFLGDRPGIDGGLMQLSQAGIGPPTILALALRHGLALLANREHVDAGRPADGVVRDWRGLHFRRREAVRRQLRRWSASALTDVLARLQGAVLDTRVAPALAPATTGACLYAIADMLPPRSSG